MKNDLLKAIEEYRKKHPEINDIMKKFQMSQEAYDRALASIGSKVQRIGPTYISTDKAVYNVRGSYSTILAEQQKNIDIFFKYVL